MWTKLKDGLKPISRPVSTGKKSGLQYVSRDPGNFNSIRSNSIQLVGAGESIKKFIWVKFRVFVL